MSKSTVLACVLALSGFVAAPVFADCAADLTAVTAAAAKATDAAKKAAAEEHVKEAKSHLAMGHEEMCAEHVAAANAALK